MTKNIIHTESEHISGTSALALLRHLARGTPRIAAAVHPRFVCVPQLLGRFVVVRTCDGSDSYFCLRSKGKEATLDFRVSITRIEHERKEETRALPGFGRMDEPVFNVPRIGKPHLRSRQDHEPLMILPDGHRGNRFFSVGIARAHCGSLHLH